MTPTLIVRNIEQQAAFLELDGQISDGQWENARPYDHYKVWCDAEVKVARPGELLGRTFYARKSNYNFTDPSLLSVIGKRMLGIIRIARHLGIEAASELEHCVECETPTINWDAEWNKKHVEAIARMGISKADVDEALANESYTMEHMLVDLRDLKKTIRIQLAEAR